MKFELKKEEYSNLESIIKKIASDNQISDVEAVSISLDKEAGIVNFKISGFNYDLNYRKPKTKGTMTKDLGLKKDIEFGDIGEDLENENINSLNLNYTPKDNLPMEWDDNKIDKQKRRRTDREYQLGKPKYKDVDRDTIRKMEDDDLGL